MAWWSSDPPSKTNCLKRKVCRAILSIRARRGAHAARSTAAASRGGGSNPSHVHSQTGCVAIVIGHVDLLQNAAKEKKNYSAFEDTM